MIKLNTSIFGVVFSLMCGVPVSGSAQVDEGLLESRQAFFTGVGGAVRFRNIESLFPVTEIEAPGETWVLPYGEPGALDELSFQYRGERLGLQDFLVSNRTNALLVIKDGEIVTEIYRNGSTDSSHFMSFSTGKSITSTVLGIARDEGLVKSLDEPLTKYIPKLTGSAYEGVTIRQALQMSTGTDYSENYAEEVADPDNPSLFENALNATIFTGEGRFSDHVLKFKRIHEPGTVYNYNTFDTGLLGTLVANASGMPFEEYVEQKLWQPAGMESDLALVLDGPVGVGEPLAGGGYLMTLRDFGRFGQLILDGGKANGRQIVSKAWLIEATRPDPDRPYLHPPNLEDGNGYQHQWWLFEDGSYSAEGVFGQYVYIDEAHDLVIVKLSYWEDAWDATLAAEAKVFFNAVARHLD